ncbi:hypothetical protein L6R53_02335 [Myxococcota bacterium]|nr:hypothetical protein [Myxococcota bacterium]
MIDVMSRLKIHHIPEGGTPQAAIAEKCRTNLRSVQRVLSDPEPMLPEVAANQRQAAPRRGRLPKADPAVVEQVRGLLAEASGLSGTLWSSATEQIDGASVLGSAVGTV